MKDPKTDRGNPIDLDQLSTAELERLLQNDFLASRGQTDPEFVTAAMEVIASRKDKPAPEVDVDTAWETFRARMKQEHGQEEATDEATPELPSFTTQKEPKTGKRRWLRRTVAAAAVVAVLACLSMMPVQGTSLLGTLVGWTDDTVSFLPEENTDADKDMFYNDVMYPQVEESVSSLTDLPVLPTWYPEGSSIIRVEENAISNGHIIVVVFSLEEKEFSLSVGVYDTTEKLPIYQYEKNEGTVEEYYSNNIPHYIMGNVEQNSVVWRNGPAECSIQGFLSVDTLKKMIDSIYS